MRRGTQNLVDHFFDGAHRIVHQALLHAGYELYEDGKTRGRQLAARVFHAYLRVLDGSWQRNLDPRREPVDRPGVTLAELHAALAGPGGYHDLTEAEVLKLCNQCGIVLSDPHSPFGGNGV